MLAHESCTDWYGDCSAVNSQLVGEIHYSCIGGQIRTNSSACQGPCNSSINASETALSGTVESVACSSFMGSTYDGIANVTCTHGVSSADTSGCVLACYDSDTATVTVNGN
ncbi:unnamed protein product, partial [Effrenium voratum]